MKFSTVYPLLVNKVTRKGRTQQEVDAVIQWLTGYDAAGLAGQLTQQSTYETFFDMAPAPNPNAALITGVVCGVRVETLEDPLVRNVRYLDKLVDELAKGKALDKVLRTPKQAREAAPVTTARRAPKTWTTAPRPARD